MPTHGACSETLHKDDGGAWCITSTHCMGMTRSKLMDVVVDGVELRRLPVCAEDLVDIGFEYLGISHVVLQKKGADLYYML